MSDLVAVWNIALSDGIHKVEFEHGTTTGKRIIRVDGVVSMKMWICVCSFHPSHNVGCRICLYIL